MGPGCERVTRTNSAGADVVTGYWKDGRIGVVRGNRNTASTYGQVVFGRKAIVSPPAQSPAPKRSGYYGLVSAIVEFFKTGTSPVPIEDTVENHGVHGGGRREQGTRRRARAVDRSDGGQVAGGQVAGAAAAQDSDVALPHRRSPT